MKEKLYLKASRSWMSKNTNKHLLLFLLIVFGSMQMSAQMRCRSTLGGHLKPFSKKIPISWAIEGTMSPGKMTSPFDTIDDAKLTGGMLIGALDFKLSDNHSIYIEGGYKNWKNSALVKDEKVKSRHFGIRQFFYGFSGENTKVKLGLHEMRLGDFFLVDERVLGFSIDKDINAFTLNVRGGSVMKNFARMGQFCSNRHLYGVLHPDYTEKIGKALGDTNMAGIVLNWNPHYKKETSSDDEFSEDTSDEFSSESDDEFSNADSKKEPFFVVDNVGFILYDEFGKNKFIPDNKFYMGSLVDIKMPNDFKLQTGMVYQNMKLNNALVYTAKVNKSVSWKNASNTKFSTAVIGKYNVDDHAIFQPLFSNLFVGEVMRMDAPDFPLWQAGVKHRFPGKHKFHVELKAVGQIENAKTNEQNIEVGMLLLKNHFKVTLLGSHVQSQLLPNDFYTARIEMRLAF